MTGSDVFYMPMETTGFNPVVAEGNSSPISATSLTYSESFDVNNHNKIMNGFPMPQGEAPNHFQASIYMPNCSKISYSDTLQDLQLGRDISGDFSNDTSYPFNNIVHGQLTEGMPLSCAYRATLLACKHGPHENFEKFATSAPDVAYPLGVSRTIVTNDYTETTNQSIGNSWNCGYEGVPIDSSTRWGFDKIVDLPELGGTITKRIQQVEHVPMNACMSSQNAAMSMYSPGSSRYNNELSLSLAMSQPSVVSGTGILDQHPDISCSGMSTHSSYEPHLGHEQRNLRDISSSSNSCKPGQLSQLLSGSRYLSVMQEILADFAGFSIQNLYLSSYPTIGTANDANSCMHSSAAAAGGSSTFGCSDSHMDNRSLNQQESTSQSWDFDQKRKKHLLTLLQEVDNQYSRWLDELHTVISAFHAVTELDPQIHARFALQTISLLYKDLKERISSHILAMGPCLSTVGATEKDKSFEMSFIQKQWALQQLRRRDQQLWRPQRGLPERSVSVLRAWMFQNFLHPYPKDAEKHLLAVKSGLTRSQVSNWFINARVRLWKPLIEEMYAEMNKRRNRRNQAENESGFRNHVTFETQRFPLN